MIRKDPRAAPVPAPAAPPRDVPAPAIAAPEPADVAPTGHAPADLAPADLAPADLAPADLAPADLAPADLAPAARPAWQRYAVVSRAPPGTPRIAIVIDDIGIDRTRSAQAIAMAGPLTLAFLPYASDVDRQAETARAAGHELLIHLPMEPMGEGIDPGPGALRVGQSPEELVRLLDEAFGRVEGYVGLNNHMGSRFTEATQPMEVVLREVAERGLLFLDSRTTPRSVAGTISREFGIPFASRDVFIDHDRDPAAVRAQLREIEAVARRRGIAVGIGHPVDVTLEALAEWLPGLAERGFALVPISALARVQPSVAAHQDHGG